MIKHRGIIPDPCKCSVRTQLRFCMELQISTIAYRGYYSPAGDVHDHGVNDPRLKVCTVVAAIIITETDIDYAGFAKLVGLVKKVMHRIGGCRSLEIKVESHHDHVCLRCAPEMCVVRKPVAGSNSA